ncbi:MAG: PQQ-dependent sugar dehydrogenase [Hyphomicrobiaceae bacterium]
MTGTIFLEKSEYSVGERDGAIRVQVVRTGDLSGPVTVEYGVTSISATPGLDYVGSDGFVTMPAGVDRVAIPITILDDNLSEQTESFTVSIINVDSGTLLAPRTARIDILDDENPVTDPSNPALVSKFNVAEVPVVTGLVAPIDMEFAPQNPSLAYIAEKRGIVKVVDMQNGQAVSTFLDIRSQVNDIQDRGLLDIALHPDFPTTPYLYAFYVVDPPETQGRSGNAGPDGGGNRFSYVSRFTADAANDYLTIVPGSETIILGGAGRSLFDISGGGAIDSTSSRTQAESGRDPASGAFIDDYLKVDSRSHAGGALAFGPDGALYVSTGDGTSFNYADPRSLSVQDINSLSGKILRVDPLTGEGLADNPFVEPGMDLGSNTAKVYQIGLRNPFSMGFDNSGNLLITDTGWNLWEEINVGGPGANFGWPFYEGGDNGISLAANGYKDLPEARAFYDAVARGDIEITAPYRGFSHRTSDPGFQVQAITGGNVIYDGNVYPRAFANDFFFSDFSQGEVFSIDADDRRQIEFLYKTSSPFAPAHFTQGPDGFVYYIDIARGAIGRLDISGGPAARYDDVPNVTQYVEGTLQGNDEFVIDGLSADYAWSVTEARDGHVVWGATGYDLLYNFETIAFNDRTISLPPIGDGTTGLVVEDDPTLTQFLTGTDDTDQFVIDANSTSYSWSATEDGRGTVVWHGSKYDILFGFEQLVFNDRIIDISGASPLVIADDPDNNQYLTGTSGIDRFVIGGPIEDYGFGPTDDGTGVVIWKGDSFDILRQFEVIEFSNATVQVSDILVS